MGPILIKASGLAAAAMVLSSCVPMAPTYVPAPTPVSYRAVRSTNYELNTPVTATVGSRVLRVEELIAGFNTQGSRMAAFDRRLSGESNFEILYSGRDSDSLRFQYREYTSDNMARDAFSQALTYPRDATTIRFRDYVMEVESVDADSITVRVISEPPLTELPSSFSKGPTE